MSQPRPSTRLSRRTAPSGDVGADTGHDRGGRFTAGNTAAMITIGWLSDPAFCVAIPFVASGLELIVSKRSCSGVSSMVFKRASAAGAPGHWSGPVAPSPYAATQSNIGEGDVISTPITEVTPLLRVFPNVSRSG